MSHDAIVVLGCATTAQGRCSPALARRVRAGVRLWLDRRAPTLLLSGGAVGGRPSEAQAMAELASSLGVPPEAMLLEEDSVSTRTNASCSAQLLGPQAAVLVVSDDWHLPRALVYFRRHFRSAEGHGVVGGTRRGRVRAALRELVLFPLALR